MRLFCLAALTFSSVSVFAGTTTTPRPETTTYVDGNITGVTPHTGGTLVFSNEKAMQFRTGLATVEVPYANILKAELGARQTHSRNAPAYKVWALPKRLGGNTQTQLLLLEFKGDDGEPRSMTLELAASSVSNVVATINSHRGASESPIVTAAAAPAGQSRASSTKTSRSTKTASTKATREPKAPKVDKKKTTEVASAEPAPKPAPKPEWWGDSYWKTTRNAGTWKPSEAAAAPGAKPATTDKPSQSQQ